MSVSLIQLGCIIFKPRRRFPVAGNELDVHGIVGLCARHSLWVENTLLSILFLTFAQFC